MREITIEAVPNQTFSITLDGHDYDFEITEANGCMGVTIVRDDVPLISGVRAVANFPLIPYAYLEDGNFVLYTANDELPDWQQFGITQGLLFVSQTELADIRAGT